MASPNVEQLADGVTLYCGDCLDILPTIARADAVVTDPPYGINAARDRKSQQWGWRDYGEGEWDLSRPDSATMATVLAAGKHAIVWGGNYFPDMLPAVLTAKWLVWDKCQEGFSLADAEFAWCSFPGAIRRISYSRSKAIQDGKEHPTQKALAVMTWCLGQLPKGCRTIVDPFMGSGTTGVAAVSSDLGFVGIEKSPRHFDTACRRIADELKRPRLFAEPAPVYTQEAMAL